MGKKIINFGYNNYDELKDVIKEKILYEGEYIDLLTISKKHYLFTRVTSKSKESVIDVREIIQNIYSDGSSATYANQEKSLECLGLEKLLNDEKIKRKIKVGAPIIYILNDLKISVKRETLLNDTNTVICVKPHVFENARDLMLKYSNTSFLDLCKELEKKKKNKTFKYGFNY